jgi:hypothetical protein
MPNLDLKNKSFEVPKNLRSWLNDNESMSYSNMNKKMSELKNKDKRTPDDEKVLKWLKTTLKKEITANEAPKRIKMETGASGKKGGGNNFKDTHKKDRDNANPTAVGGIPDVRTMVNGRHIVNNTVGYVKEEYDKEMLKMIYLIEYMDNNKKTKLN